MSVDTKESWAINLRTCSGRHHGYSIGYFDGSKRSSSCTDNQFLFASNVERTLTLSPLSARGLVHVLLQYINAFQAEAI